MIQRFDPKNILIAVLSIIWGSVIYITSRQNIIVLDYLNAPILFNFIEIDVPYNDNLFLYCYLFCLPDALWYFALLLLQVQYYRRDFIYSRIILYISILLPFILEILQLRNIISGTFDMMDILFYILILIIVWIKEKKLHFVLFN